MRANKTPNERTTMTTLTQATRDEIITAVESADLESPEQVADLCIDAAEHGRDWRAVLARSIAMDAGSQRTSQFADDAAVAEWINSVDESGTRSEDIADELADAWLTVFGRELADEDDAMRGDAWSHLCAAVL